MRLSGSVAASFCLSLLTVFGCDPPPQEKERTLIDDLGQQVRIKTDIRRIVSLVPSLSEMVCLLDCDRLKGGTRYDRFPQELLGRVRQGKMEIVGGGFDPSLEAIVRIDPDLVLSNGPSQQRSTLPLRRIGYPVLSLHPRDTKGVKRAFLLLAELLGQQTRAQKFVSQVEGGLEAIRGRSRNKEKKRVYLQIWSQPLITIGRAAFPNSLLEMAGGINVFADLLFDSGKVSLEWVIQRNPEVLIFIDSQRQWAETALARPTWRQIEGVKNNHICWIHFDVLRPTIQFLEGVEQLHRCLWGKDAEQDEAHA